MSGPDESRLDRERAESPGSDPLRSVCETLRPDGSRVALEEVQDRDPPVDGLRLPHVPELVGRQENIHGIDVAPGIMWSSSYQRS